MVVDKIALDRLHSIGGDNLVNKMTALFRENVENRCREISEGVESSETQQIIRGFHSIKSSAGNVGATRLQKLAAEGEAEAEDWAPEKVQNHVQSLREEFRKVMDEIEVYKGGTAK
ncbi:MAG: Hpt domain-containing protein [Candidatus Marinimicrobia bacterium]|nr:Hpt domain-containing protein [Candidatus Neomarinimicrobiota bacterium]MCF7829723.1 Hpt domain-containing protein [Candidatus Neomarinimicrobiota bacterium]MCF7881673.1 Hpt domain-containing protein [Candidatus Neomarinimicrobiota bacterium]